MAGRFTVETVFKGTDNTSGVIDRIEKRAQKLERGLGGASRFVDKGFGAIKQVGAAIAYTGVAAAGAGIAFAQAIAPGADFDEAMAGVGAVSLLTRDQVADLEVEARRLGKTTKYSAVEVAGGMELMGKAGFDNGQIIAGIGPILAASAAEGADFAETTSIISNVMKGMGLAMSETGRVADVLTLASDEGLVDAGLKIRTMRLPDRFQEHDKPERQYDDAALNAPHIVETVLKALRVNSAGVEGVRA